MVKRKNNPIQLLIRALSLLLSALLCACASSKPFAGSRPFNFDQDTFAYSNELVWEYHFNDNGKWVHERREPDPDYTHHCFVVARSARQFFQNARFDPSLPRADDDTYRQLIDKVISVDPERVLSDKDKIIIPGYGNLREFSAAHERLLKEECGGAWQSYFQRGHWRMIFPFNRAHQEHTSQQLLFDVEENRPPVVHVVRFPQLSINHALLVFAAKPMDKTIEFDVYDPNKPDSPKTLTYDRATRTFSFPGNDYWPGGRVDVYEIYRDWNY
jgi:hypothetical protein